MINLTEKDLIRLNQEMGEEGQLHNESSLQFALNMMRLKKSWLHELAYLLRCLLVDHVFKDGNKRTALATTILYLEDKNISWDKEKLVKAIHEIAKNNYRSIEKIMRVIKNATIN